MIKSQEAPDLAFQASISSTLHDQEWSFTQAWLRRGVENRVILQSQGDGVIIHLV